jgi:long-chain acyl-CoA synthetase
MKEHRLLVEGFLEQSARLDPNGIGLVCAGRRLTYEWLDQAATRLAHGLRAHGVRRGDRVVIQLENSVEAVLAVFATLKAGGVFVLVNPTVKAEKLEYILQDCGAAAVVTDRRLQSTAVAALTHVRSARALVLAGAPVSGAMCDGPRSIETVAFDDLIDPRCYPSTRPPVTVIDIDLAAVIYTSGSTGRPKGVMLTHANMVTAASSIDDYLLNASDDVILNVLPLSFDYGLYQMLLTFKAGARFVLERSFVYPSVVLDLIASERVTAFPVVPTIVALLLRHDLDAYDLTSLRYMTNTGAVLPTAHIKALRTRLPHVRIFSMYGLTECKRVSYLPPEEIDARPTSVGKPMPNVEVYLVDEDGRRIERGVGELVVRGPNVMLGYWGAANETARVLKPGRWPGERVLHTGDIFRIDTDGYLYFDSRTDDVIKSRGQKVSPREVEHVLHGVPGVCEAVVVGVSDPIAGETVKGYVTLHPGVAITEQDILLHCSQYLEDFMVPSSIEIRVELPRNGSGKLARNALQSAGVN